MCSIAVQRGVAGRAAVLVPAILRVGLQEAEVIRQDVLDSQEHVAKAGAPHLGRERLAVIGDRRGHRLHHVLDLLQARLDDRLAERLEALDVERDVVVDDEDRARAVVARVLDVGEHALEAAAVEVAAAHGDDRAEAAVEGAAARGLDDVDRLAEQRVAVEHASASVRQPQRVVLERADRARRVVAEAALGPEREPGDAVERPAALERSQQLRKRLLALARHHEVDARRGTRPGGGGEARVVAAGDDPGARPQRPQPLDQPERRAALEGHHRQPDHIGLVLAHQPIDRRADLALGEHQVGDGHAVVRVDVAGERAERRVRHADGHGRSVLERVRHREQQDVHGRPPGRGPGPGPAREPTAAARPE